jgi:hypothetical protein
MRNGTRPPNRAVLSCSSIYTVCFPPPAQGEIEADFVCEGLLPDEAIKYLEDVLVAHQTDTAPLYAIVGTGHHSKGGKDKLARAIRAFLDEWKYAYREFSASGDRNGGILGIDPSSFDKSLITPGETGGKEARRK